MTIKRCAACNKIFESIPQVKNQNYCSDPACQRERRRRSQIERRSAIVKSNANGLQEPMHTSPNPTMYWRRYRERNPDYAESNRNQQRVRNRKRREDRAANEAVSMPVSSLPSGRYRLSRVVADGIANEAFWIVEITVISSGRETQARLGE